MDTLQNQDEVGVGPTSTGALDPRQELFIRSYFDANSNTFGNCYQSALTAGYSMETARNLMHNRPKWLSEKLGQMQMLEPELLLAKLSAIIGDEKEVTTNKLRAIDMMMRHYKMFNSGSIYARTINIQNVLD